MAPEFLVDFDPDDPQATKIGFSDCFDIEIFYRALNGIYATPDNYTGEVTVLDGRDMFSIGCVAQRQTSIDSEVGCSMRSFMRSLVPAPVLMDVSRKIKNVVQGSLCVQLRIESDWQRYMEKKLVSHGLFDGEEMVISADGIFEKISNTPSLKSYNKIYACCDEEDLRETKEDLKERAERFGYELFFKSDIVDSMNIKTPKSRFLNSIIDFDVALASSAYVGLTRSTFSNCLAYVALDFSRHYVFNIIGSSVVERKDRGLHLAPASIVKLLGGKL